MKYVDYLKTAHWNDKRKEILSFWENSCMLCKSGFNLHVHHNNYNNLFKETVKDVVVLCENCHKAFHKRFTDEDFEFESLAQEHKRVEESGLKYKLTYDIEKFKDYKFLCEHGILPAEDRLKNPIYGPLDKPEDLLIKLDKLIRASEIRLAILAIEQRLAELDERFNQTKDEEEAISLLQQKNKLFDEINKLKKS